MAAIETRDRLVNVAMKLFWEKGYGATSIQDILREADVHAGSLYHFFPTKQDLLVTTLERYRDGIHSMLLEPAWKGVDDPIERIFALLERYRAALVSTDFFYGCPIGSLALELHEPDPPIRALLSANFHGWTSAIEKCLDDAGARIPKEIRKKDLASLILTVMEGGVMQSRTHQTVESFDAAVRLLRDYLRRVESPGNLRPASRTGENQPRLTPARTAPARNKSTSKKTARNKSTSRKTTRNKSTSTSTSTSRRPR